MPSQQVTRPESVRRRLSRDKWEMYTAHQAAARIVPRKARMVVLSLHGRRQTRRLVTILNLLFAKTGLCGLAPQCKC